jgi:hypothetical protein
LNARKYLAKMLAPLARRILHRAQRLHHRHEIAKFDGISIVETGDHTPFYRRTIEWALYLIQQKDPRRYARVKRYIGTIVNRKGAFAGATYNHQTKTCEVEFTPPTSENSMWFHAAWYASTLVHEATHGWLTAHGIKYSPETRARIEALCVLESGRFINRLDLPPKALELMKPKLTFDAVRWEKSWSMSPQERLLQKIKRTQDHYLAELRSKPKYHIPT